MRPLAWTAVAAAALALAAGFIGRASKMEAFDLIAGLLWLVAIGAGIALLPFWRRILPRVEPMPGLFVRPREGERWCSMCGSVAPKGAPCDVCGDLPPMRRERAAEPVE